MIPLSILYASSEVVPFAKTGGLADVGGILPRKLAAMGHNVVVALPRYGTILPELLRSANDGISIEVKSGDEIQDGSLTILAGDVPGLEYWLIGNDFYFNRPDLYRDPATGKDYTDNDDRFIFFSLALYEAMAARHFTPDIIHANDWQSGLLPVFQALQFRDNPRFAGTRTMLTIHNLAFQGTFPAESFNKLGLPESLFFATGPFEFWGRLNILKAAISYADVITTVSKSYAAEIQTSPELGAGLEGVLRNRREDLHGIINGVDYREWSPSRDRLIPHQYFPANLSGKRMTKIELLRRAGLPYREDVPLIGMISRLADQKGFDLIKEASDRLLEMNTQVVILGTGETKYHELLTTLETEAPDKIKTFLCYDNELAHWIEAGADIFLMPSRYEPCGLNQLYSLKYGTIPVVRATGGLADTVEDIDENKLSGTGFVFHEYEADEMLAAIQRAINLFARKRNWRQIMKNGMNKDFSWENSAREYEMLYRKALNRRQ